MTIEVQKLLSKLWNKLYLLGIATSLAAQSPVQMHKGLTLMGSRFDITIVHNSEASAEAAIEDAISEIQRIESLISSWSPDSETSKINRNAGIQAVRVSPELFKLIQRSVQISQLTQKAFDISYAAMDDLWRFDRPMEAIPSKVLIQERLDLVGVDQLVLNPKTYEVFLPQKGMKIGFGAIGKGYAADRAKALLKAQGVPGGIINASGDLSVWGANTSNQPWTIALTHPLKPEQVLGVFDLIDRAVVTSGDYQKYHLIAGEKYSHIIDPRTGYPSKGVISSTVFAPKAELADALATALFVLGPEVGIDLIDQLAAVECLVIDQKGTIFSSKNIAIEKD